MTSRGLPPSSLSVFLKLRIVVKCSSFKFLQCSMKNVIDLLSQDAHDSATMGKWSHPLFLESYCGGTWVQGNVKIPRYNKIFCPTRPAAYHNLCAPVEAAHVSAILA